MTEHMVDRLEEIIQNKIKRNNPKIIISKRIHLEDKQNNTKLA